MILKKKKVKRVFQYQDYLSRGPEPGVANLSYYEYIQVIKRVKKIKKPEKSDDKKTRRPFNHRFDFDDRYPLHKEYEQQVRSMVVVPILAGATRPKPPPPKPMHPDLSWKRRAQRFVEYMTTLFLPWDYKTGEAPGLDWNSFCDAQ